MGIRAIPIELSMRVASYLAPEDLFHWALTCHQFEYLIRDNAVCRACLQTRPFSREFRAAEGSNRHDKGLRTYAKRQAAVWKAQPFSAAILKGSSSLAYANGYLCLLLDHQAHLLHLDGPRRLDWSFDIEQLLLTRLPQVGIGCQQSFRPLHYDNGLFSFSYSTRTEEQDPEQHWLVVVGVDKREILTTYELDGVDDIWVRNTREWLYCGISAETEEDDVRTWVLSQFDAQKGQWDSNSFTPSRH